MVKGIEDFGNGSLDIGDPPGDDQRTAETIQKSNFDRSGFGGGIGGDNGSFAGGDG